MEARQGSALKLQQQNQHTVALSTLQDIWADSMAADIIVNSRLRVDLLTDSAATALQHANGLQSWQ
jgi:hypothetical protein